MKKISKLSPDTDELLIGFMDQVLSGRDVSLVLSDVQDDELKSMLETVIRLQDAFRDTDIGPEEAARMRSKVIAAWYESRATERRRNSWLDVLQRAVAPRTSWQSQQSRMRFRLAVAVASVVVMVLVAVPFVSSLTSATPAGAGQYAVGALIGIVAVFIILAVVALFWAGRKS